MGNHNKNLDDHHHYVCMCVCEFDPLKFPKYYL
jgi:hypothetical protein